MALFTSRTDELVTAIAGHSPQIEFNNCIGVSMENLFRKALEKDPRLLAMLSGYKASFITNNGLVRDYTVLIEYNPDAPGNVEDVLLDNGTWDVQSILRKGAPQSITLVSKNRTTISQQLQNSLTQMTAAYEGIHGYDMSYSSFPTLSEYEVLKINFNYILPMNQLRMYQAKAQQEARAAWQKILGKARVPQFVKPFLALSYLTQEAIYDHRCHDEVCSAQSALPTDPIPHLGFGPLGQKRGICSGLAWAFKHMMDAAHIECRCVSGVLKSSSDVGHMWNMVRVDGQYYHVDLAIGIDNDGVCVRGLMKPDGEFRNDHIWKTDNYPAAHGRRFGYDYVEDYLAANEAALLGQGADEKYLFPEQILD